MRQGGAQRRRGHADKNMEHVLQIILTADGQLDASMWSDRAVNSEWVPAERSSAPLLDPGIAVQDSLKLLCGQILSPLHQSLE